ncbi:MAG: hypothetical protein VX033_03550, partial [Verrucomicrobiota bacterium]|nr:hypothetical protein [Verrucomicrobiota bacterium]
MSGANPLREGGLGIKVLARDGISLRKTIFLVRNLLIIKSKQDFLKRCIAHRLISIRIPLRTMHLIKASL